MIDVSNLVYLFLHFCDQGANARSYVMEYEKITVILESKIIEEKRKLPPSVSVISKDIKRISAAFEIANNVKGTLYYYLSVKGTTQNQEVLDL